MPKHVLNTRFTPVASLLETIDGFCLARHDNWAMSR